MPVEFDDRGLNVIGLNLHAIKFYDDDRALRGEIFLGADGKVNIGSAIQTSTDYVQKPALTGVHIADLAGWEIKTDHLSKGTTGMSPSDWPFWAGQDWSNRAIAPFRVNTLGQLWATDARIAGDITATTGSLGTLAVSGALTIGAGGSIVAGSTTLSNSGITIGQGSINLGSGAFTVSNAGALHATSGDIAGWTIGSTTLTGGNLTLDKNGVIKAGYTSGVAGYSLNNDGSAEFSNVRIRGELSSAVFKYSELQSTAGTFGVFKSASTLSHDCTTAAGASATTLKAKNSDAGGALFAAGSILRLRSWTGAAINDNWLTVVSVVNNTTYSTYTCTLQSGSAATFKAGTAVVDYGPSGSGFIALSADGVVGSSANMTIADHAGAPWSTITPRVRLGNLNGSFGLASDLYGVGIGDYAGGNYLRYDPTNGFVLKGGAGNVSIDSSGVSIAASSIQAGLNAYKFTYAGSEIGGVYAYNINNAANYISVGTSPVAGYASVTNLLASANAGYPAQVYIGVSGYSKTAELKLDADVTSNRITLNTTNTYVTGGLNVGSATGATVAGYIFAKAPALQNSKIRLESTTSNAYSAAVEFLSKNTSGTQNQWTLGTNVITTNNELFLYDGAGIVAKWEIGGATTFPALAGAGNRAVYSDANGKLTNTASDGRLKTNVTAITDGLALVKRLRGVRFNWLDRAALGAQREIGLIAQEVQSVVPEVVGANNDGTLSIDYPKLAAVLVDAIQTIAAKVGL